MSSVRRVLSRILTFFTSSRAETELAREIDAHLRLLEDGFLAQGMSPDDARYAARRAFGGVEQVKEHQRDERSYRWLAGWSMDLRLGVRMLVKYPGLTLIGGCAIAFGIAVGAAGFEGLTQIASPSLPLPSGHRIVAIEHVDLDTVRSKLAAVELAGGYRTVERNLAVGDGVPEPIAVAEISASAFEIAGRAPTLGRTLSPSDEAPGAGRVMVIGEDVWKRRFGSDPAIIGRSARLGAVEATVVGVMPADFGFPVSHEMWVPLPLDVPGVRVFARLSPGVRISEARAALAVVTAADSSPAPAAEHSRPQIVPYLRSFLNEEIAVGGAAMNAFIVMFLLLICANVASLVFARAVTRHTEIAVRTALGASRRRIVMQLFAESLVLAGVAAVVGLFAARSILGWWWLSVMAVDAGGRPPFWLTSRISVTTVLYAAGLTIVTAAIAGVLPALKVTGRHIEGQLRQASAGNINARFGGVWTAIIVAQVAMTVAFPATAFFARQHVIGVQAVDVGFPSAQYLSATLRTDREADASYRELERRLLTDPAVAGVTFTDRLPRTTHPARRIEFDDESQAPKEVSRAAVALNYFDVLGAPIQMGRGFHNGDLASDGRSVVVNDSFVRLTLGGRHAIGQRFRYAQRQDEPASHWFEIVGVVKDLGTIHDDVGNMAGVYHPAAPRAGEIKLALHLRTDPAFFAPRLRATAAAVDSALRVHDVMPLDRVGADMWNELDFLWRLMAGVSILAMILSLAGIYSIMSFTVSRRTREIGIRIALGADARRIVGAILAQALRRVGGGVVAGGVMVGVLTWIVAGLSPVEVAGVTAYSLLMLGVCLLACTVPTRRALQVQPTEALRAEA
jgi:putative ABC transport system permease protein